MTELFSKFNSKLCIVALMASLLSACGFHLRGDYDIPDELQTLSLTSYDSYSTLTRTVEGQLRLNNIKIVQPAANVPNLHLISESVSDRTLSLYQNMRTAEKEITYVANYRVTVPSLGDQTYTTSVTRSYLDNPLTALAKSVERDLVEDEMRQLASTQMIRQMARLKAHFEDANQALEPSLQVDDATHVETVEIDTNANESVPTEQ